MKTKRKYGLTIQSSKSLQNLTNEVSFSSLFCLLFHVLFYRQGRQHSFLLLITSRNHYYLVRNPWLVIPRVDNIHTNTRSDDLKTQYQLQKCYKYWYQSSCKNKQYIAFLELSIQSPYSFHTSGQHQHLQYLIYCST